MIGVEHTAPTVRSQQHWLLTLLPAFPLVLLVLRLWFLSRQDLPTMLLLVQYVSPLGLVSALVITTIWVVPTVVLVVRFLGGLLLVSAADPLDATRSLLAVTALRMPDWVVVLAVLAAGLTWQLRFLPALLMLSLAIMGITGWQRHRDKPAVLAVMGVAVPIGAGLLAYLWLAPGIAAAADAGEVTTMLLLALPPALAALLTGPVPPPAARLVTHWPAAAAALVAPFVVGVLFLRTPILPATALELQAGAVEPVPGVGWARPGPTPACSFNAMVATATPTPAASARSTATPTPTPTATAEPGRGAGPPEPYVLRGHVVTVDDRFTTLLRGDGRICFVPNGQVRSQALCPGAEHVPSSVVHVRGWYVEDSALEWIAPVRRPTRADPRCQGRPEGTG